MSDQIESVHVHKMDVKQVIKEYGEKGFVLQERTLPTIVAQMGFVKLIFVKAETADNSNSTAVYLG